MLRDALADSPADAHLATDGPRESTSSRDAGADATLHDKDARDDTGGTHDVGTDTSVVDAGPPCLSGDAAPMGLEGIGVPSGTTAQASGYYSSQSADGVITGTGWNAGAYTGWVELTFPASEAFDGIQLLVGAAPSATETYTLTGYQGGASVSLGTWTEDVPGNVGPVLLPPMTFVSGAYHALRIDVNGGASWVAINQVSLLTPRCGGPVDAGSLQDSGPLDAADTGSGSSSSGSSTATTSSTTTGAASSSSTGCNAVPEPTPAAGECQASPAPTMTGGTILDGTYDLTYFADYVDLAMYGVPPCQPGQGLLFTYSWSLVVSGGGTVLEFVQRFTQTTRGNDPIASVAYNEIAVVSPTCGAAMGTFTYTVTPTQLLLAESGGRWQTNVYTFTLQP